MPLKIHNSGLCAFRRCRRRWDLGWRQGWRKKAESSNLWFGSAIHDALEAFELQLDPIAVFMAYIEKRKKTDWVNEIDIPADIDELSELGVGMLTYYINDWLPPRRWSRIVEFEDGLLTEVKWAVPIGSYMYEGKFDGVVADPDDLYWIREYKTAKAFNTAKLVNDPQVTAYTWAAQQLFGRKFGGIEYVQLRKVVPEVKELKRGGLSKSRQQIATYATYKKELRRRGLDEADYEDFLNYLLDQQSEHHDPLVRRDFAYRTQEEVASFEQHLKLQLSEYTNRHVPIYTNPTRDCTWDCDFLHVCQEMEQGNQDNANELLETMFTQEDNYQTK